MRPPENPLAALRQELEDALARSAATAEEEAVALRRKRRTVKQRALLQYKQRAAVSIGETRDEQRERVTEAERRVIQSVHAYIWNTRHVCQLCGGRRQAECEGRPDEMHEDPSRAETRGRPPGERFNLTVCGRLCWVCHQDVTAHRIQIIFADSALGFLGPVTAVAVEEGTHAETD